MKLLNSHVSKFGIFERITAGFCMSIPFILLIVDNAADEGTSYWLLLVPILLTAAIALLTPIVFEKFASHKAQGIWLTVFAAVTLLVMYLIFARGMDLTNEKSISAYVNMRDSFIFGMVLTIGGMLFMTNGVVYFNDEDVNIKPKLKPARKLYNFFAGVFLLGVVVFPCTYTSTYYFHMGCALLFFGLCIILAVTRDKKGSFWLKLVDWMPIVLIGLYWWWNPLPSWKMDLFGAESVALWIVGVDFILVSLKREKPENK